MQRNWLRFTPRSCSTFYHLRQWGGGRLRLYHGVSLLCVGALCNKNYCIDLDYYSRLMTCFDRWSTFDLVTAGHRQMSIVWKIDVFSISRGNSDAPMTDIAMQPLQSCLLVNL